MKQFFGTLLNVLIWVVIILLFFLVVSGFYQRFYNKDGYTGLFGIGYAVVVSGSMEPNIHINDLIIYQEHDAEDYEVGQVIVYERIEEGQDPILIIHRIQSIEGTEVVTKGDANKRSDNPITMDDVIGFVVWRLPYVGFIMNFVKTPLGLGIAGAAAVLLCVINLIVSAQRKKRERVTTVSGEDYIVY